MKCFLGATFLHALMQTISAASLDGGATCMERECVVRAGRLLNAMNSAADPCTNFLEFACGGTFQEDHSLPTKEHSSVSSFEREDMLIMNELNNTFENEHHIWIPRAPETKAKEFYESCKRSWFTQEHGIRLLDSMAHALGVPELYQQQRNQEEVQGIPPTTYGAMLRLMREQFGAKLVFNNLRMRVDDQCISVPYQVLTKFKDVENDLNLATLNFFKSSEEQIQLDFFKNNTAKLIYGNYCDDEIIQDVTLSEMIKESPSFGWQEFLNLQANDSSVDATTCIIETSRRLAAIFDEHPLLTKKFLIATAMKQLWTQKDSVKSDCLELTKRYFGEALTFILKDHKSTPDTRPIERMAEQVRAALERRLLHAPWLDFSTRDLYLEKIRNTRFHIGYPNVVDSAEALNQFHSSLELSGSLPEDLMRVGRWREEMSATRCDLDIWDLKNNPLKVDAFNIILFRSVAMFFGIIRGTGYDQRLPSSFNYGGLAMVLGHEIMHSIDSRNRHQDSWNNNIKPSNETAEYLDKGEKCLMNYYNTLENKGISVNGSRTLGEDISDVYGIQLSYEAWKEQLEITGPDPSLPGVSYTPEQLFFIWNAQLSCSDLSLKLLNLTRQIDTHAPGFARVIGSTAQSTEFAAAFSCSSDDLPERCSLW